MILMTFLMLAAPLSGCIGVFEPDADDSESWEWIDPVSYTHLTLPTKA